MFGNVLKPIHVLILVILVLLLFGANRLPELAKSVGQALKIFKAEIKDLTDDSSPKPTDTPVVPPATPAAGPSASPSPLATPPPSTDRGTDGTDGTGAPRV